MFSKEKLEQVVSTDYLVEKPTHFAGVVKGDFLINLLAAYIREKLCTHLNL